MHLVSKRKSEDAKFSVLIQLKVGKGGAGTVRLQRGRLPKKRFLGKRVHCGSVRRIAAARRDYKRRGIKNNERYKTGRRRSKESKQGRGENKSIH